MSYPNLVQKEVSEGDPGFLWSLVGQNSGHWGKGKEAKGEHELTERNLDELG